MARSYDQASSEYHEVDATPVTAVPLTIAGWMYPADTTTFKTLVAIVDKDVPDRWFAVYLDSTAHAVAAARGDAVNDALAVTTATHSASTWIHVAGVFDSNVSRSIFLNGANKVTNTNDRTPSGLDRFSIGRHGDSTPGTYMNGRLAEVCVWNVALSDNEIALLARGINPLRIRAQSLLTYHPLFGNASPEPNLAVGGGTYNLAATGTIDAADHPPVRPPFAFDTRPYISASAGTQIAIPVGSMAFSGSIPSVFATTTADGWIVFRKA